MVTASGSEIDCVRSFLHLAVSGEANDISDLRWSSLVLRIIHHENAPTSGYAARAGLPVRRCEPPMSRKPEVPALQLKADINQCGPAGA